MRVLVFRKASEKDVAAVLGLLMAEDLDTAGVPSNIESFFVAVVDDVIVGCIGAEYYEEIAYFRSFVVRGGFRGGDHSISFGLVRIAEIEAKQRNCVEIWGVIRLGAVEKNEGVISASGYEILSQEDMPRILRERCQHVANQKFPLLDPAVRKSFR